MSFTTVEQGLARLREEEEKLATIGHRTLSAAGGALYTIDFYCIGAVKRGLSVSSGFRSMIEQRNLLCAGALLRMQLETAFRFFGLSLTEAPHDVATALMGGMPMNKMKSRDGKVLRDSYLAEQLAQYRPWVRSVYAETSKFVHFTEKQIFAGLINVKDEERSFEMVIGVDDAHVPEEAFLEALGAFDAATTLLSDLIQQWGDAKSQRNAADSV